MGLRHRHGGALQSNFAPWPLGVRPAGTRPPRCFAFRRPAERAGLMRGTLGSRGSVDTLASNMAVPFPGGVVPLRRAAAYGG